MTTPNRQEFTERKTTELAAFLEAHRDETHAIILQDFPDPDAISCGYAYQLIAAQYHIATDMLYGGRISHQENLAMINLLGIEMIRWREEKIHKGKYHGCIFVDNQGTTSLITPLLTNNNLPALVVIDHHVNQELLTPQFLDLRPLGACASILTSYLMDGLLPCDKSNPAHRRLATALMHGILSDTGSLTRAQQQDFTAAAFLQPYCDQELLVEILGQQRSHRVMELIRIALANRLIREGYCLSGVGYLRAEDRDAIPQAADFLLSEENVHTAIVFGVVTLPDGNESIQGSLRTHKLTLAPDDFLKEALGQSSLGNYYGGGKALAGGFEIPLGFLSGQDTPELANLKWEAFNAKIRRRIYAKIGVEEH